MICPNCGADEGMCDCPVGAELRFIAPVRARPSAPVDASTGAPAAPPGPGLVAPARSTVTSVPAPTPIPDRPSAAAPVGVGAEDGEGAGAVVGALACEPAVLLQFLRDFCSAAPRRDSSVVVAGRVGDGRLSSGSTPAPGAGGATPLAAAPAPAEARAAEARAAELGASAGPSRIQFRLPPFVARLDGEVEPDDEEPSWNG